MGGDITLHDLASFIGLAVASSPAVELAPLRYKFLEIIKNRELALNAGNFSYKVTLDIHALDLVNWWVNNIDHQTRSLPSSL